MPRWQLRRRPGARRARPRRTRGSCRRARTAPGTPDGRWRPSRSRRRRSDGEVINACQDGSGLRPPWCTVHVRPLPVRRRRSGWCPRGSGRTEPGHRPRRTHRCTVRQPGPAVTGGPWQGRAGNVVPAHPLPDTSDRDGGGRRVPAGHRPGPLRLHHSHPDCPRPRKSRPPTSSSPAPRASTPPASSATGSWPGSSRTGAPHQHPKSQVIGLPLHRTPGRRPPRHQPPGHRPRRHHPRTRSRPADRLLRRLVHTARRPASTARPGPPPRRSRPPVAHPRPRPPPRRHHPQHHVPPTRQVGRTRTHHQDQTRHMQQPENPTNPLAASGNMLTTRPWGEPHLPRSVQQRSLYAGHELLPHDGQSAHHTQKQAPDQQE